MSPLQYFILATLLVAAFVSGAPTPGGAKHEKYIIHVPIKYHTIHHVKVEKVPVYVKKHIHHHKYAEEEHHEQPAQEQHDFPYSRYDEDDEYGDNSKGAYTGGSYENSNEYYR